MPNSKYSQFTAAAAIYAGFAIYLYQPYFRHFKPLEYLFVVNSGLAALGCFTLSRLWIRGFFASLFAGAIYGFGPFVLSLTNYHPAIGFLSAAIGWLFCPAAFITRTKRHYLGSLFAALPFLAIILFFTLFARMRFFPMALQERLYLADLTGLLFPLVAVNHSSVLVGFYHIPLAALIFGFLVLIRKRQFSLIIIFAIGVLLTFCNSFCNVSPLMWIAIPVLCCSVLIGKGISYLTSAGFSDRKPILFTTIIMGIFAIVALLLATKYFQTFAGLTNKYAMLFVEAAKLYMLSAISVAIIYFVARAKLQIYSLRLTVLCSAISIDIFFSARFIIDKIF